MTNFMNGIQEKAIDNVVLKEAMTDLSRYCEFLEQDAMGNNWELNSTMADFTVIADQKFYGLSH